MTWKKIRKIVADTSEKQKEKQTTNITNDGQDSYLAAVRRFVGGSDLAQQKAASVLEYARQNAQNAQRLASTLTSGAMSQLKDGDISSWNRDTARQAEKDSAAYREYLSGQGVFDSQEYATNPTHVTLPSSEYLKQLAEQFQMDRARSLVEDDHARASKERTAETETRWQQLFKEKDTEDAASQWYNWLMADYLLGDRSELFDIEALNEKYDAMDDETYYAEEARLRDQFNNLDWETLTGSASTNYVSRTPTYDAYLSNINSELERRKELEFFAGLANAPDFAQYSEYTDPTPEVYTDNAETMHDLINAQVGEAGMNALLSKAQNSNLLTILNPSFSGDWQMYNTYLEKGYDMMSDEEVKLYTYLYNNPKYGAPFASAYLNSLSPELTLRRCDVESSQQEAAATNGWTAAGAWLAGRAADIANLAYLPQQIAANLRGENDPNAAYYDALNTKSTIHAAQEEALGNIEALNGLMIGGKNIAQHAYNIGSTAADSGLALAIDAVTGGGGKINQALMGTRALSGGMQESAQRGISGGEALLRGGVDAFMEALSEKLGAGPDALTSGGKTFANIVGEGAEEVVSNLGTTAADEVISDIFGSQSAFDAEVQNLRLQGNKNPESTAIKNKLTELATDFVYGAASGGLLSIPGAAAEHSANRTTGKTVQTQGDAEAVLSIAESMKEDTQSYVIAKDIRAKLGKGGKVSTYQLGRLTRQLEAELSEEHSRITNQVMDDAIANRLMELGDDAQTAKKNAPTVRKVSRGQESTAFERVAVKWNDNASQVVKELAREVKAEGDTQRTGMKWQTDMTIQAVAQTGEVVEKQTQLRDAVTTPKSSAVKEAEAKAEQITKGRKATGKNLTATKIAYATEGSAEKSGEIKQFVKDGDEIRMVIKTDEGEQTVAVSDMTDAAGKGTATIIEYTARAHNAMSAKEANSLLKTYQAVGGDAGQVIENFDQVYAAGYAGIDMPTVNLPDSVKQDIYAEARKDSAAAEETRTQRTKAARSSSKGVVTWLGKVTSNDQVTGTGSEEALTGAMEAMTESQRSTVEGVKAIAQAANVNIVFFESDLTSKEKIQNGSYHEGTNTIYLDINSGANDQEAASAAKKHGTLGYAMMRTLSHELTHYIEASSAEGYAHLKTAMKQQLKERGLDWATLVRGKLDNAAAQHIRLTRAGAEAEVIADASEYMLENSAAIEKLSAGLKNKIKGFVQDFLQRIRTALGNLVGGHVESMALRQQVDGVNRYVGELQKLWDVALGETIRGVSALGETAGDVTEAVEAVQFSIRYVDNQPVVWVQDNILSGKPGEQSAKAYIKNYLVDHIDDVYTIIESGSKVYPAKQLPNEYLYSKSARNLERFNKSKYKAKLRMVSGVGEMVEIATNRRWEKTQHTHNKNARYGVYRYDTRVAFDNNGTPEAYTAELIILNADDGKKYLYDVVGIKKDDAVSERLMDKARSAAKATYQNSIISSSIPRYSENVNRENQEQYSLRDGSEDVRFSIRDGSITTESTEEERYEVLKDAVLTLAAVDESKLQDVDLSAYNTRKKSDVEKGIRALAKMLGITNVDLTNSRIDFPFTFTNKNLGKSLHHQLDYGGTYQDYVKAMSCFDEIVANAIPIETHKDKKAGTSKAETYLKQVYVLISAYQDGEDVVPVQLEVKEYDYKAAKLYLAVTMTKITPEVVGNGLAVENGSYHSLFSGVTAESEVMEAPAARNAGVTAPLFSGTAAGSEVVEAPSVRNAERPAPLFPESTISLRDLIEKVNSNDYKFFKYVPDGFLNEEQKAAKRRALEEQEREYESFAQMSLRDGVEEPSVREYIGKLKPTARMSETERLLLARYQENLGKLEEAEKGIAEQEAIITEGATGDELIKARNRLEVYRKQSARHTRELVKAERAEGFAGIMATSYQVVNDYLRDYNADRVADAADRLDAEIRDLAGQLKGIEADVSRTAQGQRNAFVRGLFNQADLNAAAKKLRDSYGARMTVKEIADRLALAYGEIYAVDGAEGAKRFTEAAKALAQDILNRSRYRYKSDVLTTLAQEIGTISLTDADLQEIHNAGLTLTEYKRALSPYIKVAEGASDLSSYLSNDAYYGGVLTAILGEDTEGNLAMGLYEVINREKGLEQAGSLEGMSESESLGAVMADVLSVNLPLSANDKTLEHLRKELLKYAGENAQAAAAVDKAISSARSVTARASAVWHRAVQEQSLGRQAVEYYRALDEQRRVLELQEQKKDITEQLRSEAAKEITRQVEEKRAEYKAREQKAREYRSVRDDVLKLRKAIGRSVKYLNTRRARETDQRHIPHELTKLVDYVLAEFTDEKLARLSFSAGQAARLNSLYNKLKEIDADDTYFWDDEVEEKLRYITDLADTYHDLMYYENGQRRAPSLESYEHEREILTELEDVIENVRRMVDAENEIFLEEKDETFREFSADTAKALLERKDVHLLRGGAGDIQKAVNELLWTGNMTPVYFFERLQNEGLMAAFNAVRDGQRAYGRILNEAKQFLQDSKERHHYDRWVGDGLLTFKTVQGHEITLTREQALWAYATAQREASMELKKTEHLSKGGFHFRNTSDDMGAKGLYRNTDKAHQLKDADIQTINNWLTAEQKAYADELVEYLSTTMGDYGNQASLAMYGYKKFREKYYFPFRTWSAQRFQRGDEGSDNTGEASRIMSAGFTKNLTHKANTALEMSDFTDVIGDHIQAMTTYATMVTPVENIKRLMNHKVTDTDNTISTIRALIGQKYGLASQTYVTDFLRDLNGAVQTDSRATGLVDKMVGAFKRGAVAGSLSVVVQQPTAIFRAMAFIAPKYFRMNSDTKNDGKLWEEMLRHSGAAVVKDAGKFDVGLGHSAAEWVTGQDVMAPWEVYRRLKAQSKTKAGKEAFDSLKEWLTFLPGWADQITWQAMWKAVKNEQHALHPEMDTSSEEFLDLCGKRFDDVMDHTQVYDSVLVKSNLMRSKNQLHKMATSFMSEPTLTLNIMIDALKGKHGKKQGAKMFTAAVVSQIAAGVLAALVQAWNDDDDERNAKEKYLDRALYNIVGNLNPLEMIPYVSNLWDTIEGFTVQRSDMEVINDLVTYSKQVSNGNLTGWSAVEKLGGAIANIFGVPLGNIMRDIRRVDNAVKSNWGKADSENLGFIAQENLIPFWQDSKKAYYNRMVSAALKGDTVYYDDLMEYMLTSKMTSESAIKTGMRNILKEMVQSGEMTPDEATDFLNQYASYANTKDNTKKPLEWAAEKIPTGAGERRSSRPFYMLYGSKSRGDCAILQANEGESPGRRQDMGFAIGKLTKLVLGYTGEGDSRTIRIDVSAWLTMFVGAVIVVQVLRPDKYPYFPATELSNGVLTWEVTQEEVAVPGKGWAQIAAIDPKTGLEYHSRVVQTEIYRSLEEFNTAEAGDPAQKWVQKVLDAAIRAEKAVEQRMPYIGENGNWWLWDAEKGEFIDSGAAATPSAELQPLIFTGAVNATYNGSEIVYVNIPTGGSTDTEETATVPDYWQEHIDARVAETNAALSQAVLSRSAILFYTDAHWSNSYQMGPTLLKYLEQHTGINRTFFGGDVISDETDLSYLTEWRAQVSTLAAHHSVAGNHDDTIADNDTWTLEDTYSVMLDPEVNADVVRSDGLYYYVDSTAESTRYICLDTATRWQILNDANHVTWLKNTLLSTPAGWHIVCISHQWWNYDHNDDGSYTAQDSYTMGAGLVFEQIDAYNARSGDYAACTGKVEFCIGGHLHWDADYTSPGGIPVILLECESGSYSVRSGLECTEGTITESSVNAIVADYNAGYVNVIRIGRGVSRKVYLDGTGSAEEEPDVEVVEPAPSYTEDNMLGNAWEKNGATDEIVYNDGWGYKDNTRFTHSDSDSANWGDKDQSGWDITGYIPAIPGDIFRIENVEFICQDASYSGTHRTCIQLFDSDFNWIAESPTYTLSSAMGEAWEPVYNEAGTDVVQFTVAMASIYANTAYIRIQAKDISRYSVITKNAEIPKSDYGYTAPTGDFTNQLDAATDTDGTVFNDGNGYLNDYRLTPSGTVLAGGWDCTGFIPAQQGDVLRFHNLEFTDTADAGGTYKRTAIYCYDSSKNYLCVSPTFQFGSKPASVWEAQYAAGKDYTNSDIIQITLPENSYNNNTAYIRIVAKDIRGDSIITVNESIDIT